MLAMTTAATAPIAAPMPMPTTSRLALPTTTAAEWEAEGLAAAVGPADTAATLTSLLQTEEPMKEAAGTLAEDCATPTAVANAASSARSSALLAARAACACSAACTAETSTMRLALATIEKESKRPRALLAAPEPLAASSRPVVTAEQPASSESDCSSRCTASAAVSAPPRLLER